MATRMLSVRIDSDTLASVKEQAAARDMSVQEYVVSTLQREGFHQRYMAAVKESIDVYHEVLAEADARWDAGRPRADAAGERV
ncbi:hypothetical protein [Streptomyces sp. NPDC054887]